MKNCMNSSISLRFLVLGIVTVMTIGTASPAQPKHADSRFWEQWYAEVGHYLQGVGQSFEAYLQEKKLFFKKFYQNYTEIGAIAPSSRFLAKAMTEHLLYYNRPLKILEVGAGTGVFTEYIVAYMPAGSELHVVEIDADFCNILKEKFKNISNVHIHCCSILDLKLSSKVDCIISGLPFSAFSSDFVRQILDKYTKDFIKAGGIINFFEYAFLPTIKKYIVKEYAKVFDVLQTFKHQQALTEEGIVLLNIPPARVITCIAND